MEVSIPVRMAEGIVCSRSHHILCGYRYLERTQILSTEVSQYVQYVDAVHFLRQ